MARKKVASGISTPPVELEETKAVSPDSEPVVARADTLNEALEVVKVNNANLTELKIALDDSVKRFFGQPDQFRTRHTHTDIRLALGWSSVIVAAATGLYGWKTGFEESKLLVTVGVVLYFVLTSIQTAYTYFVEGKTIYVGKRKRLAKRIEAERLTVESETIPSKKATASPQYSLSITYTRSTGNGNSKTIVAKANTTEKRDYTTLFDSEGTFDEVAFIAWLKSFSESVIGQSEPNGSANGKHVPS